MFDTIMQNTIYYSVYYTTTNLLLFKSRFSRPTFVSFFAERCCSALRLSLSTLNTGHAYCWPLSGHPIIFHTL